MRRIIGILVLLLAVGCKGPAGDKGDKGETGFQGLTGLPGSPGTPGQGKITTYTGTITSDSQTISIPAYSQILQSGILVYIAVGGQYIQLPIWNPTKSINVFFTANTGTLTLTNALNGSGTSYEIIVINY